MTTRDFSCFSVFPADLNKNAISSDRWTPLTRIIMQLNVMSGMSTVHPVWKGFFVNFYIYAQFMNRQVLLFREVFVLFLLPCKIVKCFKYLGSLLT